jgi:Na+/phosphate symporter
MMTSEDDEALRVIRSVTRDVEDWFGRLENLEREVLRLAKVVEGMSSDLSKRVNSLEVEVSYLDSRIDASDESIKNLAFEIAEYA